MNLAFFTHMPKPVGEAGGGMANAIVGTLILTGLGALFAVPVGVFSGIYIAEYRGTRFASATRFAADTLNGVPSIVIGIFAYGVAVLPFKHFTALRRRLRARHHDDPAHHADDRRTAPARAVEHCAKARWRSARRAAARSSRVVLPAALPGIITGILLALARIAGETAPLLFTVLQQPLLVDRRDPADRVPDGAGLPYAISPLRGLASPGVGRRAGAGHDRLPVLDAGALGDRAAGAAASRGVIASSFQLPAFQLTASSTMRGSICD